MGGHNNAVGRWGEDRAVEHLESSGYTILARNWRSPVPEVRGEVDIIAAQDDVLVVCEVKTRLTAGYGDPVEAVSAAQVRRVRALAACWLSQRPSEAAIRPLRGLRFDVIGVRGYRDPLSVGVVDHFVGAF